MNPDCALATAWLESLILTTPRPYAERAAEAQRAVRLLLAELGDPQSGLPVIHITGSKGKGSTALLLEAILRTAGLRVGTFTSPHLSHWRERFRLDGESLSEAGFAALIESIRPTVERLRRTRPELTPSFFDTATAAALLLFRNAQVDAAIVEVGLGGRLDATNAVEPRVCCITGIELEHADKLGPGLADIAAHKAGIIKPGVPVVCGPLPAAAVPAIVGQARHLAAPLHTLGREFRVAIIEDATGSQLHYRDDAIDVVSRLPLPGRHQGLNAALAIACAARFGVASLAQWVPQALANVTLPGRCEILRQRPWLVVDGAHTVESARALRKVLDGLPATERHWLLSFSPGKNPCDIAAELVCPDDRIILTRADPVRSQPTEEIESLLKDWNPALLVQRIDDPAAALDQARVDLGRHSLLCLTGSVYMAGRGRDLLASRQPRHHQSQNRLKVWHQQARELRS